MPTPTLQELQTDVAARVLADLRGDDLERGRALLGRLLPHWLEEARSSDGMETQVLTLLRDDLARDLQPLAPRDRLVALEADVLDRELRTLSNETFALGKQVIDGGLADADARARGQALLSRAEALSPKVDAITLEAKRLPLRRQLEDALLEALYAVQRQAMSHRLNRYAQDRKAP